MLNEMVEIFKIIGKELFGTNTMALGMLGLIGVTVWARIKSYYEIKYLKKKIDDMKNEIKEAVEKQDDKIISYMLETDQKTEKQDNKIVGYMTETNDGFRACNDFTLRSLESLNNRLYKITEDLSKLIGKNEVKEL